MWGNKMITEESCVKWKEAGYSALVLGFRMQQDNTQRKRVHWTNKEKAMKHGKGNSQTKFFPLMFK